MESDSSDMSDMSSCSSIGSEDPPTTDDETEKDSRVMTSLERRAWAEAENRKTDHKYAVRISDLFPLDGKTPKPKEEKDKPNSAEFQSAPDNSNQFDAKSPKKIYFVNLSEEMAKLSGKSSSQEGKIKKINPSMMSKRERRAWAEAENLKTDHKYAMKISDLFPPTPRQERISKAIKKNDNFDFEKDAKKQTDSAQNC